MDDFIKAQTVRGGGRCGAGKTCPYCENTSHKKKVVRAARRALKAELVVEE